MNEPFAIPIRQGESTLTVEKIKKAKELLEASQRDENERNRIAMEKHGYWQMYERIPRSKKKRIRKKWLTTGRSYSIRWIPPTNPDPA